MRLLTTNRFEKDVRQQRKRGKDLSRLWLIVERLQSQQSLERRHRPHRLTGEWSHCWECHVESDWLLLWELQDNVLVLIRTGTHSDLFR